MNAYVSDNINQNETIQAAMVRAINLGEPENFVENLKKLFAYIPYNLQDKFKIEQAYQVVVYIVCVCTVGCKPMPSTSQIKDELTFSSKRQILPIL